MKQIMLFAVGTCLGVIAAVLYVAVYSGPADWSSTESWPDRTTLPANIDSSRSAVDSWVRGGALPDDTLREVLATGSGELRDGDVSAAASEWAFFDPAGFFAHAEAADSIDDLIAGLKILIATDPERVWTIAARFNGPDTPAVNELYLHAVRGMAGRDPYGTIARLEGIATGSQRGAILASIAQGFATIDADAALAWAMGVVPASMDALAKVFETVASTDLLRAYDMTRRVQGEALNAQGLAAAMTDAALRSGQSPASLASSLATRGESGADRLLATVMQQWTLREPESAVAWMSANEAHLTNELATAMAGRLAFEDVVLAAELAGRVPSIVRYQWLDAVASRYGQFDLDQAMNWVTGYQGQPGYDTILARVLSGGLISDAGFVADYIETSDIDFDRGLIQSAAGTLVQQDPVAAVEWAMRLGDAERSAWAIESAVGRWAQTDGASATRWALNQPPGRERDEILDAMMLMSPVSPGVDPAALLGAYDSDAAAQRTLAEVIFRSTRVPRNMLDDSLAQAESLLEYLTSPAMREQAEEQIAMAR
jgi:hypothetical protein